MSERSIEARATEWALGRDTGASSEALAAVMTGVFLWGHVAYPSDGDDLGRCLRLLEFIPEWRPRLPEMSARSKAWGALVEHWDELSKLHKKGDGRLVYDRMKAILDPVEAQDRGLIKLGNGASIRFGR